MTETMKDYDSRKVHQQIRRTKVFDNVMCASTTGTPYLLGADIDPSANSGLQYEIVLADATGLNVGDNIGLFQNSTNPASYFGQVLSISTNTLTMDTPVDSNFYTSLSPVLFELTCNGNVDGSTTPVILSIDNDSDATILVNRVIIHVLDQTAMDDAKFGGISALTKGIVLRKKHADGTYENFWGSARKTNADLKLAMYDFQYDDKAPTGYYGCGGRYTFGGDDKHISTLELAKDEALELVIQDDLTDLDHLYIMAEGCYA